MGDLYEKARIAENAERYEDMAMFMKEFTQTVTSVLNTEQRNILSVAYKNVIGARRTAWRVVSSLLQKETSEDVKAILNNYQKTIKDELDKICGEVINLLDEKLIKDADPKDVDSIVFYHKMKGDYYRYLAEVADEEEKQGNQDNAQAAYKAATDESETMAPTHPIRLGLALNYSVFFYEIGKQEKKACEIAKTAFDNAISELDSLKEESYKDSTLIMQLLRDNLTLWTTDAGAGDDEDEPQS